MYKVLLQLADDPPQGTRLLDSIDALDLVEAVSSTSQALTRIESIPEQYSLVDAQQFIEKSKQRLKNCTGIDLAIIDQEELVGVLSLAAPGAVISDFRIGYWIRFDQQSRGLASQALASLISSLENASLEASIAEDNQASQRVVLKNGFYKTKEKVADRSLYRLKIK
jgi:RimJ/RimL family protein N-acetyltransferase